MNMTEVLEDEIQKRMKQLENVNIEGHGLTPGYIKKNTFRVYLPVSTTNQ